jgi:hypothetical protein
MAIKRVEIELRDLKDNPFRLLVGDFDKDRIKALSTSITEWNDFWASLRVRETNGELQLAWGHHRVRAAMKSLKFGPHYKVTVQVMPYTDAQMIKMLGENGYRDTSQKDRIGIVRLVGLFLKEYGESYTGQVDIHLLQDKVLQNFRCEGSQKVSNFLGSTLWPEGSIKKLDLWGKPKKEGQKKSASTSQPNHDENKTTTKPIPAKPTDNSTPEGRKERTADKDSGQTTQGPHSTAEPDKPGPTENPLTQEIQDLRNQLQKQEGKVTALRATIEDFKRLAKLLLGKDECISLLDVKVRELYERLME